MLTIQPQVLNNYRPAFKADKEQRSFDLYNLDEDSYESYKEDLRSQKEEFEDLANNEEFKLPKPLNKALKGGAVVTTGLLGGMAAGWGTGKSLEGFAKLYKSKPVQGFVKRLRVYPKLAMRKLKPLADKFKNSETIKKVTNSISEAYTKFGEKKYGKPVAKVLNAIGNGIAFAYNKIAKAVKFVYNKITGVKSETYKKVTVNTVGVSGGVAAGVDSIKEQGSAENFGEQE